MAGAVEAGLSGAGSGRTRLGAKGYGIAKDQNHQQLSDVSWCSSLPNECSTVFSQGANTKVWCLIADIEVADRRSLILLEKTPCIRQASDSADYLNVPTNRAHWREDFIRTMVANISHCEL